MIKLVPGNKVLVLQKGFKGKHKIADRWENVPYVVVEQLKPNIPVFKVRKEGLNDKIRILHQNMLFPLLPDSDENEQDDDMYNGPITRSRS